MFRKSSKDTDFYSYANIDGDWDSYLDKGIPLECENFTFNDPLVESGTEYSYKIRFVTPDWKYSSYTNSVKVTPSAGSGEFKLLNEPKGVLYREDMVFRFSETPLFYLPQNNVYSSFSNNFVVYAEGKGDYTINLTSSDVWFGDVSLFKGKDTQLNIQLGVAAYAFGQQFYGNNKVARILCFATNYFYKLPDGSFTWRKVWKISEKSRFFRQWNFHD